jgi:hypothetical protein
MLGEELATLQGGEEQSDVARRPRQFETASQTEPSADQSARRHQREKSANLATGLAWRYLSHPPNATPCPDLRPEPSGNERRRKSGAGSLRTTRDDLAKSLALPLPGKRRSQPTSDRAAARAFHTLAAARPAAGLEPRAAADEVQAAQPLPATGEHERPARAAGGHERPARAAGWHEQPAARDEAREAAPSQAPPARALPQGPDEARTGRAPLVQGHEAQAAEPERAARRPAAELRHWASAPGCLPALPAAASEPEQETLLER